MKLPRFALSVLLILISLPIMAASTSEDRNPNIFTGPYDYTNPVHVQYKLPTLHKYHFNKNVQNLKKGGQSGSLYGDLAFILRYFPNHHIVLHLMGKLWSKHEKNGRIPYHADPEKTPIFWFENAIQFAPKDSTLIMVYAIYLHKRKVMDTALTLYKKAYDMDPESSEINYNLGLYYVDLKKYDDALHYAKRAYDEKYPLPGLRNKLIAAKKWK